MDPNLQKMHPAMSNAYSDDMSSFVDFDSRMIRAITQQQWPTPYHHRPQLQPAQPPLPPPPPQPFPGKVISQVTTSTEPPPTVLDLGQATTSTDFSKLPPQELPNFDPVPPKNQLQGEPSGCKHNTPPPPPLPSLTQAQFTRREKASKRQRNPEQWKKNVKKRMRQTGQAYITDTGKEIPARRIRDGCGPSCRLRCHENFDEAHREDLFQTFWGLEDKRQQRQYIARHVIKCDVARKRVEGSDRRGFTLKYYFFDDKELLQVCRKFFVETLDVGRDFIYGTLEKEDPKTGLIGPERQGKHGKQRRVPESVLNSVREHISSFPVAEPPSGKSKSKRRYLEAGLSVAKMYRMYKEYCVARNIQEVASADRYRRVFDEDFNLVFLNPKKSPK